MRRGGHRDRRHAPGRILEEAHTKDGTPRGRDWVRIHWISIIHFFAEGNFLGGKEFWALRGGFCRIFWIIDSSEHIHHWEDSGPDDARALHTFMIYTV